MKEFCEKLIEDHNKLVDTLENCEVKIPAMKVLLVAEVFHRMACAGATIVHEARKAGIDCKINMQSGRIIL